MKELLVQIHKDFTSGAMGKWLDHYHNIRVIKIYKKHGK